MRLTIDEYAERFKMSKEMVHSRLRAKRLNYTLEDGKIYILPKQDRNKQPHTLHTDSSNTLSNKTSLRPKTTVGTIIALYQKENRQLKNRINELESKIDRLIDDKEQMLRDERDRIEKIYTSRDEQLKSFLELINTKLLQNYSAAVHEVVDVDHVTDKPVESSWKYNGLVELRKYLKTLDFNSTQRKHIKKRFARNYGHDVRIIQQNGEFFLDFTKYDYSDLLQTDQ